MRTQLGILLVTVSVPMSAHADLTPSGALSVGANVGGHSHPDDAGATLGANIDAEFRFGMFSVGGSLGYDSYAVLDGAPVHAGTIAGRAGLAIPVVQVEPNAGRTRQINAIAALEAGVHHYSPEGERNHFLGGTTSYYGDTESRGFGGFRAGAEMTVRRQGASSGVILKLEVIGRRDLHTAMLEYDRVNCGGLLIDEDDCSDPAAGMVRVGGTEIGVATSIGVQFGGP